MPGELLTHCVADVVAPQDEDVLRSDSTLVIAMRGVAPESAKDAQKHGSEGDQRNDNTPGNGGVVRHVHRAAEQEPGIETGLHGPALLVKNALRLQTAIETIMAAENQQAGDE